MSTKKKKVKDLFESTAENLSELFTFKRITTEAYENLAKNKSLSNIKSVKEEFESVKNEMLDHIKAVSYPAVIHKTTLIYAVSAFEIFLNKFLTILYEAEPRALKNNSKSLTYEEILSHISFKSLKQKMIANILHDFFYKAIADQMTIMDKKFGFNLIFDDTKSTIFDLHVNLTTLTEIYSIRNIILHNDSVVNEIFIKNNPKSVYKLGDIIKLESEYTHNKIFYLFQIMTKLCFVVLD